MWEERTAGGNRRARGRCRKINAMAERVRYRKARRKNNCAYAVVAHALMRRTHACSVEFTRRAESTHAPGVARSRDAARCAGHVQQLGSGSLLPNLMEVKG